MLPEAHRLTRSADFRACVRAGARGGSATVVAHLHVSDEAGARVGLVVSKAVGNAVVRNRVARRLRHLAAARLASLPEGSLLVLRARPEAAAASTAALDADLDRALAAALQRSARRAAPRTPQDAVR